MALDRRLVELPVQTGLQQKTDPRLIDDGAQTTLQNLVQDKVGALQKRPGVNDLGSLSSSPWSNKLAQASYNDARLLPTQPGGVAQVSGGRVWARGSTTTTAYDLDSITHVLVDEFGVQVVENSLVSFDMCTNGVNVLIVWTDINASGAQTAWFSVLDAVTYDVVQVPQQITTSGNQTAFVAVRCCSVSSTAAVMVGQVGTELWGMTFNWSTLALTGGTDLGKCTTAGASGLVFNGNFDISPLVGSANFCLAQGQLSGTNTPQITLGTFSSTFVQVAGPAVINVSASNTTRVHGVAIIGSSTQNVVWVGWATNVPSTSTISVAQFNSSLAQLGSTQNPWVEEAGALPEQLSLVADPTDTTWGHVVVCGSLASQNTNTRWARSTNASVGFVAKRKGVILASKLFVLGNLVLGTFYYTAGNPTFQGATVNPSYYVCEVQSPQVVGGANLADLRYLATIGPRIANVGLYTGLTLVLPNAAAISNLQTLTMGSTIRNSNTQSGLDLFNIYYSNALYQPAVLGDSTYIAGGVPMCFDGQRVINHGFPYQPPSVAAVQASSIGGGIGSFTYTYAAVYEWRTKTGERKQSQPTVTSYVSIASAGIASITVPSLNLSLEQDWESNYAPAVGIALYRDTAAAPGQLCRVFAADVPASLLNTFNTSLVYQDSAADGTVSANEQLYTTGNVLGAQCPPSLKALIAHQGRLAGIGGDGLVWLTTRWDEGTTQPYFNDALTLAVGDLGRPTALASMDANLIIFKRDAIYIVSGDGPQNDGTGNQWTPPSRITVDCGCSADWRGVLVFSGGVTFQNGSKLYLLSRGLEASYFSAAVEDLLIANPVIVGSAVHASRNELRYVCKPSEGATTGVVLNFNYVTQTWSSFVYFDTDAAVTGADVDACIVQGGSWYHVNFKGRVYQEDTSGQFYDVASHWITGTRETANLKTNGIQGFGRVWSATVLETDFSPHDLTIQAAYNYGSLYTDSVTFTASQIASFLTAQPQMMLHLTQQLAESVRFKIFDGPPNGAVSSLSTGQGANLIGITVEAGVYRGRFRIPEGQAG